MKITITLVVLMIFIVGCTSTPKIHHSSNSEALKKSGCIQGSCINGKGKYQRFYKHKNVIHEVDEGSFVNGKLHGQGKKTLYTDQGVIDNVEFGSYKNNKRHGKVVYTRYYHGEKTYISTSNYINGKSEGTAKSQSYSKGKLSTESITQYHNGKKHGTDTFISYTESKAKKRVYKYSNGILVQIIKDF